MSRGLMPPVSPLGLCNLDAVKQAKRRANVDENVSASGSPQFKLFDGYQPHAGQQRLHHCRKSRYLCVIAGRRGGKTKGCAAEFIARVFTDFALFKKRGGWWRKPAKLGDDVKGALQYWLVAPTYRHTMLMMQEVIEILGGQDSSLILKYDRSKSVLWVVGGIKISARSASNPLMLVGDSLNGIWMDESARVKRGAWADNISPGLSDRGGWAIFSSTPLGYNWLYDEIWQRTQHGTDFGMRDRRFSGVHWTTADNTAIPSLREEMKLARLLLPSAIYARNYEASFTAFEGKIFSDFTGDSRHVIDRIPWGSIVKRWGGLDWGSNNPGSQIELALSDSGQLYAFREDYEADLTVSPPTHNPTADSWVNRLKQSQDHRNLTHWWADPSGRGNIQTCRNEGLDVRAANNDVQAGIDVLCAVLRPVPRAGGGMPIPGLLIHKSCKNLIKELVSYRWDDKKQDKPKKVDDHSVDALRYGVFTEHLRGSGQGIEALDWSIFDHNELSIGA